MRFHRLDQPGFIGSLRTRNRIVMPAMATNFASAHGEPTPTMIGYYEARARGGAGLIVVENASIDEPTGGNGTVQLRIDHDRYVPGLYALTRAIREGGAAAAIQINHAGVVARPERTGAPAVGPSDAGWTADAPRPTPLEIDEIERLVARYAEAAVRAKRAGFDAVEIHGAHGYLIAQFLSPITNRRADAYGGSQEGRWRFALEVVRHVRRAVGTGFPLVFRISADEFMPGGRTLDESVALGRVLAEAGVDALSITSGTAANPEKQLEPMSYPEGWRAYLAAAVKGGVDIPVIAVGVFRNPDTVERALAEEKADFIAIGRGLIADPEWPNKAAEGLERRIRRCISCNRCVRCRVFDDQPIRCSVNPKVGREDAPTVVARGRPTIVVVGAGPGGLAAADTAARAGGRVILLERENVVGGTLRIAERPPHKEKIGWLIDDLTSSLPEAVEVRTGIEATENVVRDLRPDGVIIGIGGTPRLLEVPGADRPHVVSARRLLASDEGFDDGRAVVVIGGGMVGCESAEFCAVRGAPVTLLEVLDAVGEDCEPITRAALIERLDVLGVSIHTGIRVAEIGSDAVVFDEGGHRREAKAARVVVAIGNRPNLDLAEALSEEPFPVVVVGDARDPRGIQEAVSEGWRAAREVVACAPGLGGERTVEEAGCSES